MSFSDEDLKSLKENRYELFSFSKEDVEALIARLEAAEKVLEYIDRMDGSWTKEAERLFSLWRKAAGK